MSKLRWSHGTILPNTIFKKAVGFSGGVVVKNPAANAGDMGSSPGPGRSHTPWSK